MGACEKFPMTAKDHIENHLIACILQILPSTFEWVWSLHLNGDRADSELTHSGFGSRS